MDETKVSKGKSDSSEVEKRINTIYLMLLQGFVRKQIIQYATETWGITERWTDEYLSKAREIFRHNLAEDTENKKFEILSQYYDLYQKSYKLEDYKECRSILKEIAVVLGVEAPKKIDHTTNGESISIKPIQWSK